VSWSDFLRIRVIINDRNQESKLSGCLRDFKVLASVATGNFALTDSTIVRAHQYGAENKNGDGNKKLHWSLQQSSTDIKSL
jgi:hypothetical protein